MAVDLAHFRSDPANVAPDHDCWAPLDDEGVWEYTAIPLLDLSQRLSDDTTPICAQLTYAGHREACRRLGLEMLTADDLEHLHLLATRGLCIELPAFTNTPTAETSLHHRVKSDEGNRAALARAGYRPGMRVTGFGKEWIAGAPPGRAWLMGWWVPNVRTYGITTRSGPGFVQPRPAPNSQGAHGEHDQADDGTNGRAKRRRMKGGRVGTTVAGAGAAIAAGARELASAITQRGGGSVPPPLPSNQGGHALPPTPPPSPPGTIMRKTLRLGDVGPDVARWQSLISITPVDGHFGPATARATLDWQEANGLTGDATVGAKSWALVGEAHASAAAPPRTDPRSPACRAALRDADRAWPGRRRASDGIMGDAAHQARPSDHNSGNAVDITHDPASGADGSLIAAAAITDVRVTYVIWDRHIYSRARAAEGWRKYTGSNPHTHHCHISVRVEARADDGPWPWAPSAP